MLDFDEKNKDNLTPEMVIPIVEEALQKRDSMLKETNVKLLSDFRQELIKITSAITSEWFSKILENSDKKQVLMDLHAQLSKMEIEISARIVRLQLDQEIIKKIEQAVFPKETAGTGAPDFSRGNISPLGFPQRLRASIPNLAVPKRK